MQEGEVSAAGSGGLQADAPAARLVNHAKIHPGAAAEAQAEHAARLGDFPVAFVDLYRRDCVTRRQTVVGAKKPPAKTEGRVITEFSDRSMRKVIFVVKNCDVDFRSMLTLTYPAAFCSDGRKVKKHLESFREDYLKRYCGQCGVWWLEFQKRGAPHFHILSEVNLGTLGPLEIRQRRSKYNSGTKYFQTNAEASTWLAERWASIVGGGLVDPDHLKAGTAWEVIESEEGAMKYVASHAGKRKQKTVPDSYTDVGRFWGKIGDLRVERVGTVKASSADVFQAVGPDAMSSAGKVKKYLYDASGKFSLDEI